MNSPDYVTTDSKTKPRPQVLSVVAKKLSFPLTKEDQEDVNTLEKKFDAEQNCAGLAAPQIGISKQIIVFSALDIPELKKWRPDFTQTMEKTIWINPSYEAIGTDQQEDYEGCFSVINLAGNVKRYKKVRYKASNIHGESIEGVAEGFLARIIQHEVDHLNGKLFMDYLSEDQLMNIEEYRKKRDEAMKS